MMQSKAPNPVILKAPLAFILLLICLMGGCRSTQPSSQPTDLPNILWIVSEDNSPFLGCYGDSLATTSNLDQLAAEGMVFDRAYANAPVCAPARFTLITGTYASSLGTENMRSTYPVPDFIRFYPEYLREKGYYCTNRSKKDYNTPDRPDAWDESGKDAHYSHREGEQPFFHIINIGTSHESSVHKRQDSFRHDPAKMNIPPYHPDLPEVRADWAQAYDRIEVMDQQVGEVIEQLKADGLYDKTIIFYYSDHGGIIARSKRYLYESGLHVPMMVRFPEDYAHLMADYQIGGRTDRLVGFVDFGPTLLSLADIKIPDHMQGRPFLGKQAAAPDSLVFSYASRMDGRMDLSRTVTDGRYRYIRNFMPERPQGLHLPYLWRAASVRAWEDAFHAGILNETQRAFWLPKAPEELYDIVADPHNVRNLAMDTAFAAQKERLKTHLFYWMDDVRDMGLIPEAQHAHEKNVRMYQQLRSGEMDYAALLELADYSSQSALPKPEVLNQGLEKGLPYAYWAMRGYKRLSDTQIQAKESLWREWSKATSVDVRSIFATALLYQIGEQESALAAFHRLLENEDFIFRYMVLECVRDLEPTDMAAFRPEMTALAEGTNKKAYDQRLAKYLLTQLP